MDKSEHQESPPQKSRKIIVKAVAVFLSVLLLIFLYQKVDFQAWKRVLSRIDAFDITLMFLTLLGMMAANASRWKQICSPARHIGWAESFQLISVANSFDSVVPMKLGSLSKGLILYGENRDRSFATGAVVYEKLSDIFGACLVFILFYIAGDWRPAAIQWLFVGCGIYLTIFLAGHLIWPQRFLRACFNLRPSGLKNVTDWLPALFLFLETSSISHGLRVKIHVASTLFWMIQAVQFAIFMKAVELDVAFSSAVTGCMTSFLAGLLPVSFMGLGVREMVLVHVYESVIPFESAMVIGMLCFARTLVPALIGLLFVDYYIDKISRLVK